MRISKILTFGYQVTVPTIDISNYLNKTAAWKEDCRKMAKHFEKYGLVSIKDPRVHAHYNTSFIDLLENYFTKR